MTVSVSLDALVDRALAGLRGPDEAGQAIVLPADLDASETEIPAIGGVSVPDVLEFDSELMRVRSIDEFSLALTVVRGYAGTTATVHANGSVGTRQPTTPRIRVENAVLEAFPTLEANRVLPTVSDELPVVRSAGRRPVIEVAAHVREVLRVRGVDLTDVPNWQFVSDLPASAVASGQAVRMPNGWTSNTAFVTWIEPYRWSSHPVRPAGSDTIDMVEGTEFLPSQYAIARLLSGREISRQEIDRAAEWNQAEPSRGGISTSFVRQVWQDFYRSLDEARKLNPLPTRIHVHRRQLIGMGR